MVRPFCRFVHLGNVDAQTTFEQDVPPELVSRLQRGDLGAFDQIYRRFERPAWALAVRLTARADVADEVLQDAMLKAFERARQYRGPAPFAAWLRKLVVNEALMRLRKDRRGMAIAADDDLPDTASIPPWVLADAGALARALRSLPDVPRAVLWLYYVEGYTHAEIAGQFGRSVSFSKSQLARGTARLRELLLPQTEATPCPIGSTNPA